ncbi:hypothetical protein B1R94_24335 [Mycolicibacterium litorale]|nr:hypothetical protein B1R94_24335 [Mycolicibacterium litorale]
MPRLPFAVAAATAAVVAGCAPSPAPSQPTVISPAPSTSTGGSATPEHGSLAHCLHEHGVPDSAGTAVLGPPPGVDPGTWDEAMQACSTLAPGPAG